MSDFQSIASKLFAYEEGQLNQEETLVLFQSLVDSGMIFDLQGSHQRTAQAMIDASLIRPSVSDRESED